MQTEEQAFWDLAACAALGGDLANTLRDGSAQDYAVSAVMQADALLAERRKRVEKGSAE
jgi:hypothetical protein